MEEGFHIGESVLGSHRQGLHDGVFRRTRNGDSQLGGGLDPVAVDALNGVRRQLPGNAAVQRGPHGVYVRPGPLIAVAGVLLLRGIAVL